MKENIDSKRFLNTEAFWVDGTRVWISSMGFNGLYMYDMEKKETKFICSFPMEEHNKWRMHGKALKVNEEIYFIPNRSQYVHVYNLKTDQISSYFPGKCKRMDCKNAVYTKGKIYFISDDPKVFLYSMDVKTKEIGKHSIDIENYSGGICSDMIVIEDKVYLACKKLNIVIEYILNSNVYHIYTIASDGNGFGTINYDGDFFWLSDNKGVLKWRKGEETFTRYDHFPEGFGMVMRVDNDIIRCKGFTNKYQPDEKPFSFSVIIQGSLWLFPLRTNMIIKIDLLSGSMSEICIENEKEDERSLFMKTRQTHCHFLGGMQGSILTFSSTTTKRIYVCDCEKIKLSMDSFLLWSKEPEDLGKYLYNYSLYQENEDEIFTNFVEKIGKELKIGSEFRSDIGKTIFDNVNKSI